MFHLVIPTEIKHLVTICIATVVPQTICITNTVLLFVPQTNNLFFRRLQSCELRRDPINDSKNNLTSSLTLISSYNRSCRLPNNAFHS